MADTAFVIITADNLVEMKHLDASSSNGQPDNGAGSGTFVQNVNLCCVNGATKELLLTRSIPILESKNDSFVQTILFAYSTDSNFGYHTHRGLVDFSIDQLRAVTPGDCLTPGGEPHVNNPNQQQSSASVVSTFLIIPLILKSFL